MYNQVFNSLILDLFFYRIFNICMYRNTQVYLFLRSIFHMVVLQQIRRGITDPREKSEKRDLFRIRLSKASSINHVCISRSEWSLRDGESVLLRDRISHFGRGDIFGQRRFRASLFRVERVPKETFTAKLTTNPGHSCSHQVQLKATLLLTLVTNCSARFTRPLCTDVRFNYRLLFIKQFPFSFLLGPPAFEISFRLNRRGNWETREGEG